NCAMVEFANVLEQLETTFYSQALSKFQPSDFTTAGFSSAQVVIQQITAIGIDEATHTTIIQEELLSLAQTPLTCQFDFTSVLTDVSTMATVARLVENVGVGAYLGAAHLLTDPTILTAAASIATVEARHQTMLNVFNNGQAIPNAFDLPLLPNEVLAIAGGFIQGCNLGITANTPLTVTNTQAIVINTQITFSWSNMPSNLGASGLFCQLMAGGMPISLSLPITQCAMPSGMAGPVAVWITSDNQALNNNARDRSSTTVVAGPTIVFVDIVVEEISQIVRVSGSSSGSASSSSSSSSSSSVISSAISTSTVSLSVATALIASATATATGGSNSMVSLVPAPSATA
ncbi:ferritin-like domain-containing protein, partial [Vararia minispora EC-137]